MLPEPLHPVIVHFPVVLALLLPIFAGGALWAIRRGARPLRAWAIPAALAAALALSSWVAVETGEAAEDTVERVVPHAAMETHEDAAELFLVASGVLAVVAVAGLARGAAGRTARVSAALGTLALVALAFRVGHSGGQLVYRYGAASAYTDSSAAPVADSRSSDDGDDDR